MLTKTTPALCALLLFLTNARMAAQPKTEVDSLISQATQIKDTEQQRSAWLKVARTAQYGYPEAAVPAAEKAMNSSTLNDATLAALGDALREADEPLNAVQKLSNELRSYNASQSTFPLARLSLARALVATQRFHAADSVMSIVARTMPTDPSYVADALTTLGDIRSGQYRAVEAQVLYNKARASIQGESTLERERAELLLRQTESYIHSDHLDTALILGQHVLDIHSRTGDLLGQARGERMMGNVYTVIGDYAKAASHLERATQLARKAGSRRMESMALNGLAYNAFLVLDPKVVEGYWWKALALADSIGSAGTAARVRIHYGNFYLAPSTLEAYGMTAEEGFAKARAIIGPAIAYYGTNGDERLRTAALMTLSNIHNYSGETEESHKVNREVFRIGQRIADRKIMARSLVSTGSNYFLERNYKHAIRTLDSALVLCSQASMGSMMGTVMYRLSSAHEQLGHYAEALAYMKQRNILLDSSSDETKYRSMGILEAEHHFAEVALADSLKNASALRAVQDERTIAELRAERSQAWAAGLGILIVMSALGTWFFIRTDRSRRKAHFELRSAQLETKALRAQMNPHFLFNALASINGYIGRNQPDVAKDFVARFGKLTRQVLENSTHNEVSLAKDLEALELYLQLERSRSDNTFDYRINVDPGIDQQFVKVPPMVLQPLVENAIWHGMAQHNGTGLITIDITERDDQLIMQVTDNGVGMKAEQMTPQPQGRTSMGTSITRTRLELIERMKGRAAVMRYLESSIGTKVEVTLPV